MSLSHKIVTIFLLLSALSKAQEVGFTKNTSDCHTAIWQLEFNKADSLLDRLQSENSADYDWLTAYKAFVYVLVTPRFPDYNKAQNVIEKSISNLESDKQQNNKAHLVSCYLYSAYLHYLTGSTVNAFAKYYQAVSINIDLQKGRFDEVVSEQMAIMNLFVDFYLKSLPMVGSVEGQLQIADEMAQRTLALSKKSHWPESLRAESLVFAITLLQFVEPDSKKTFELLKTSFAGIDNSAIVTLVKLKTAQKAFAHSDYHTTLEFALNQHFNDKLNVFNLEAGSYYANGANMMAYDYLNRYCKQQENGKNASYAWLKMAWLDYVSGRESEAKILVDKIISENRLATDEEKQAYYEAQNFKNWSGLLIKARMYFDNGEVDKAEKLLIKSKAEVSTFNKEQKLEMAYRLGRCYQLTGKIDVADKFYKMAIGSGLDKDYYYPAYAAYYAAQMWFESGQNQKAESYANRCLELDSPIYKESIHQKARNLKRYLRN